MNGMIKTVPSAVLSCFCKLFNFAYLPYTGEWFGLGNRIKGLANFYSLGYRRFLLAWNTRSWVTVPFGDLFKIEDARIWEYASGGRNCRKGYDILTKVFRRFAPIGVVRTDQPYWSFIVPVKFQRKKYRHRWSFLPDVEVQSIDFRFDNIDEDIRAYYRHFFENLKPSKTVTDRIESLKLPADVVSVQIRNTGIRADQKDVASIEAIYKAMDEYPDEQVFFISAMNAEIAKSFHDRYGERCMELPNKNYASMVDAVADMWHLGHCREMIASPSSTFSEVAWWWGGAHIPVRQLKSEYNQRDIDGK